MALVPYNFPADPFDGQLYPNPPTPGAFQYRWDATLNVWALVSGGVSQVLGNNPIVVTGTQNVPVVNIRPASASSAGSLSAEDYITIKNLPSNIGTVSRVNTGTGLTGGPITTAGTISLKPASGNEIGGVKPGQGVTILPDGTLEAFSGVTQVNTGTGLGGGPIITTGTVFLKPPSGGQIGGVKAGTNITIASDGTISAAGGGGGTGSFVILDDISSQFNGTQKDFLMTVSGGTQTVTQPANVFLVVGGVLQPFGSAYTIANLNTIRFNTAPVAGTTFSGRVFVPNGQSFQLIDNIAPLFNGTTVSFQIKVNGNPYQPASPASLFIALGGVIQTPNYAYTISGNIITFTSAPPAGTTFNGQVLGI